ncbi:RNA polymerase sigma factor SigJ [Streptomyces broussonetiae]|uniref:Sigma-70 family RNA polymerase sigma factor n=1 Tax=Streptomyces broussonetiae TaxID=2686304 RepID=A0A6I6N0C0_9ACTN|nr:RNA polymerase sigma factor SigJ [Streptomyces broussonetiae]QHA06628.1 sigma-70 family RNA polymerase sigma factor [Streptomyces broussonetiae]
MSAPAPGTDPSLHTLFAERRRLINLSYRMLGSVQDAEDVVQETYIRWYALSEDEQRAISSPMAWLTKAATRICLDHLASARVRRERYIGQWLPEPLRDSGTWSSAGGEAGRLSTRDPGDQVTLDESVSMGMLVVLESMTPAERVAFVLHDVFGMPFAEVADTVGRSPAACRQLAASARRQVTRARSRTNDASRHSSVIAAFRLACETGDLDALIDLLALDVRSHSDGGGKVRAAARAVVGRDKVARLLLGLMRKEPGMDLVEEHVNGRLGFAVRLDGNTIAVIAVDVGNDDRVTDLWMVLNPDKLQAWQTGDEAQSAGPSRIPPLGNL